MKIMAELPNGRKVPHGQLMQYKFVRHVTQKDVRWSDRAFCINSSVIPVLKRKGCQHIVFVYSGPKEKVVYQIGFDKAMSEGTTKVNEYNERNLRIPISSFDVKERHPYPGQGHEEEPGEDSKEQALF